MVVGGEEEQNKQGAVSRDPSFMALYCGRSFRLEGYCIREVGVYCRGLDRSSFRSRVLTMMGISNA